MSTVMSPPSVWEGPPWQRSHPPARHKASGRCESARSARKRSKPGPSSANTAALACRQKDQPMAEPVRTARRTSSPTQSSASIAGHTSARSKVRLAHTPRRVARTAVIGRLRCKRSVQLRASSLRAANRAGSNASHHRPPASRAVIHSWGRWAVIHSCAGGCAAYGAVSPATRATGLHAGSSDATVRVPPPYPQSRTFADLLIDCEENRVLRAVLVGMLRESQRP
jgi:hypothetical protein